MSNPRILSLASTALAAFAIGCGGAIDIRPPTLPNAVQNKPYSTQLIGSGAQPVSWRVTAGTLPPGVTLNATNGLLSGTPTAFGSFVFTVKGQDSSTFSSNTGTENYSLEVIPQLALPLPTSGGQPVLPTATAETSYSFTLEPTGGVPPYTATVTGLHAGLTFASASSSITGTPPLPTHYTVAITVQDSGTPQQSVSAAPVLLILPPNVVITTETLPNGHVTQPFRAPLATANGSGSGDFSWSISNGLLPSGLSLDTATGTISGTPTVAGTTPITVSVTDNGAQGYVASKNYTLVVVNYRSVQINTASLPAGTVGTPYPSTLLQTIGGSGTFLFTVEPAPDGGADPLPAGLQLLQLDAGATISGTPTVAGTSTFSIQVSDVLSPPDTDRRTYSVTIAP